jgi:hypothetical protein
MPLLMLRRRRLLPNKQVLLNLLQGNWLLMQMH